jgi:hypothetical protein
MSVSSTRSELLDILSALFPDVEWRNRAAAREIADFAIAQLPAHTSAPRGQRALGLAYAIRRRIAPARRHS